MSDLPKVPRVKKAWYVLARSGEVQGNKPLRRRLWGSPVVMFRGSDGHVGALVDRCPHRDIPLSFGDVVGNNVACGYHGWQFDRTGECKRIPAFEGTAAHKTRCATAYPVREQQDFIWVWADPNTEPDCDPYWFEWADRPGYLTVRHEVSAEGSLHALAENALDVPHTAFLHRGLFRNDNDRNPITCVLERHADKVVCEYIGEPRPPGFAARLLSPSGGAVKHFDRFFMPCVVQVEYAIGDENHILTHAALTPIDDHETMLFSVVCVRSSRIPKRLIRPLIQPLAMRIFQQDAVVMALQKQSYRDFGSQKYTSTEIDLLGPHILKLLNRAARGQTGEADRRKPYRTEVRMMV